MKYTCAVVTISDSACLGTRPDASGPVLYELATKLGFSNVLTQLVPDEYTMIRDCLIDLCDVQKANLILTTGGTGFSPRDITPEATKAVLHRDVPGISEAMRNASIAITPRAMLSRGISGIRKNTLIINMPGSPKAVAECFSIIEPVLLHALDILNQNTSNCARE